MQKTVSRVFPFKMALKKVKNPKTGAELAAMFPKRPKIVIPSLKADLKQSEQGWKVSAGKYQFNISQKPQLPVVFEHQNNLPLRAFRQSGVHLLAQEDAKQPQKRIRLISRQIQSVFYRAYKNCKNPIQCFNLQRKIKQRINHKLSFVGILQKQSSTGKNNFKPLTQIISDQVKTRFSKGITNKFLKTPIVVQGDVWTCPSADYLRPYVSILQKLDKNQKYKVLDIGCGSGSLSFLFAKYHPQNQFYAIDNNPSAIKTILANAPQFKIPSLKAIQLDVTKQAQNFVQKTSEAQFPSTYDFIIISPPISQDSYLDIKSFDDGGEVDFGQQMFEQSVKLAKKLLAPEGKIVVIYTDYHKLLGVKGITISKLLDDVSLIPLLIEKEPWKISYQSQSTSKILSKINEKAGIWTYLVKHWKKPV